MPTSPRTPPSSGGRAGAPSTPQRLLDATEALLGERDERDITVRELTARAGANIAAVGYHFGSREDLLLAALERVVERTTRDRRAALEALAPDASLEEVVRAWLAPAALAPDEVRDPGWPALARAFASGSPTLTRLLATPRPEVETELLGRLAARLPGLGPEELAFRHAATLGVASFLAGPGGAMLAAVPPEELAAQLTAYVCGALRAPPVRSTR